MSIRFKFVALALAGCWLPSAVSARAAPVRLAPLSAADIARTPLSGELACSFALPGARDPVLLARGVVASKARSQGVVKLGTRLVRIGAPGGYDGMLRGATFAGAGVTIRVAPTGAKAKGGGESPALPARLTLRQTGGASRTLAGAWTCGP